VSRKRRGRNRTKHGTLKSIGTSGRLVALSVTDPSGRGRRGGRESGEYEPLNRWTGKPRKVAVGNSLPRASLTPKENRPG